MVKQVTGERTILAHSTDKFLPRNNKFNYFKESKLFLQGMELKELELYSSLRLNGDFSFSDRSRYIFVT